MVAVLSGTPLADVGGARTAVPQASVRTGSGRTPIRLTRRGRLVLASASALVIGLLSVVLATAAQATHAGSSSPGRYVTKVLVRPGQSLWTLAETYDPSADPRVISAQIQQLNSMTSDQLQPGQVLWVPRG